jgi:hypothetical protein
VGFAVSTTASSASAPAIRVSQPRVLSHHVNLLEPVLLGTPAGADAAPTDVTITFALRGHEGATFAVDAASLNVRTAKLYTYPPHAKRATPPVFTLAPSRVALEGGASISCWTDQETGRAFAQVRDANGSSRGEPVAVSSPGMTLFGEPQAVTSDGRHVVITFFASDEDGFALVAASLEPVR